MLLELAQSPDGPIHLITGEPPAPVPHAIPWPLILTLVCAAVGVALILWALFARRLAVKRQSAEHAFRALARRLRLPPRHAAIIRKLASCAQCSPVALLVSDHALQAAAMCFEKTGPSKRDAALLRQLLA
jgi:hypothetical protein